MVYVAVLKSFCILVVFAAAAACAQQLPAEVVAMAQHAESIEAHPGVLALRSTWVEHELPSADKCAAPRWLPLPSELFNAVCGEGAGNLPACSTVAADSNECVSGCTRWIAEQAYAMYDAELGQETPAVVVVHETAHAFADCVSGGEDWDDDHSDARIWAAVDDAVTAAR